MTPNGTAPGVSGPRISVIITAHSRADFLRSAVSSVVAQSLPSSEYEIVVVKNFEEAALDAWLGAAGARLIRTDAGPLGAKIAAGIEHSRGSLLSFLEDDDRFEPTKLEAIASAFDQDPTLVFVHNRFRYVDEEGRPYAQPAGGTRALRRVGHPGTVVLSGSPKDRRLGPLASQHPDFNCSSMTVSRALAERARPLLDQVKFAVDTLLFYCALASDGTLRIDERILTEYRLHSGNVSAVTGGNLEEVAEKKREHAELIRNDYDVIRALARSVRDRQVSASGDALVLVHRIYSRLRDPAPHRQAMLRDLLSVPRLQSTYVVRTNLAVVLGSVFYLFAPHTARRRYLQATRLSRDEVPG